MSQPPPTQTHSGQTYASATVYVSGDAPELFVVASALRLGAHRVMELDPRANDFSSVIVRPCVVLADRSGDGALALLRALGELTDADRIDVVLVFDADTAAIDGTTTTRPIHVFRRPLDVAGVIAKISELINAHIEENGPPSLPPDAEQGRPLFDSGADDTPPPLSSPSPMGRLPTPSPLLSYAPVAWTGSDGPPSSSNPPMRGWPSSTPPAMAAQPGRRAFAGPTSVSADLEGLLAAAEHRVFAEQLSSSDVPTPEEEVNAVLPPDVLAALDEPLDVDRSDERGDGESESHTPAGSGGTGLGRHAGTGSVAYDAPVEPVTATGEQDDAPHAPTTGAHPVGTDARGDSGSVAGVAPRTGADAVRPEVPSPNHERPAAQHADPGFANEMPVGAGPAEHPSLPSPQPKDPWGSRASQPPPVAHAMRTSARPSLPPVISPAFDGLRWLASCAAGRTSGSVCFEDAGVQRRAVLRDGDFVTCASSSVDESLISYLLERGDLPRDVMAYMAGRVPAFGRHAAAALIATGFLGQDQLWSVLRGHSEWLLSRMIRAASGVAAIEMEAPGRLKAEPSVFGGATGAEVLVEVCRRTYSTDEAVARMGGGGATLAQGHNASLLAECALDEREQAVASQVDGMTVQHAMDRAGQPEFSSVLCALAALGVVEVLAGIRPAQIVVSAQAAEADRLDAEAVRQRLRARLAVIEEGDYFQVLGVARTATAYEIRRAFVEGRRTFEPSHLLTAATVDLADDVQTVIEVLEEAYEVLRDEARRVRYLRALEARPPSVE